MAATIAHLRSLPAWLASCCAPAAALVSDADAFLTIFPATLLLASALILFLDVSKKKSEFIAPSFIRMKRWSWTILGFLEAFNASISGVESSRTSAIVGSLSCVATISTFVPYVTADVHSLIPSMLFIVSLVLSFLFEFMKFNTDAGIVTVQNILHLAIAVSKLVTLGLQASQYCFHVLQFSPQDSSSTPSFKSLPPWDEETIPQLWRCFFIGFTKHESVPKLGTTFSPKFLAETFAHNWELAKNRSSQPFLLAWFYSMWKPLATVLVLRLIMLCFMFWRVFCVLDIVAAFEDRQTWFQNGTSLFESALLAWLSYTIYSTAFVYYNHRISLLTKSLLTSAIVAKIPQIPESSIKHADPVSVMNADVDMFTNAAGWLAELCAAILQVVLTFSIVAKHCSWISLMLLIPTILCAITSHYQGSRRIERSTNLFKAEDTRLSTTASFLPFLRTIKVSGLENLLTSYFNSLYNNEAAFQASSARLRCALLVALYIFERLSGLVVFIPFIMSSDAASFSTVKIFAVSTMLTINGVALRELLDCWSYLSVATISLAGITRVLAFTDLRHARHLWYRVNVANQSVSHQDKSLQTHDNNVVVELQKLHVSLGGDKALMDINLDLKRKQCLMITGTSGSGKSTLLKVILGETPAMNGRVYNFAKATSYCAQVAWLREASIRDNILDGSILDYEWYESVMHACCLEDDINALRLRDKTIVSCMGSNLSGGQKQRVALARALYTKPELLVLDDIFNSLDPMTANTIYSRLFGPRGLLIKFNCTVVAVAQSAALVECATSSLLIRSDGTHTLETNLQSPMFKSDLNAALGSLGRMYKSFEKPDVAVVRQYHRETMETEPAATQRREPYFFTGLIRCMRMIGLWKTVPWMLFCIIHGISDNIPAFFFRTWLEVRGADVWLLQPYIAACVFLPTTAAIAWNFATKFIQATPSIKLHDILVRTIMRGTWSFLSMSTYNEIMQPLDLYLQRFSIISNVGTNFFSEGFISVSYFLGAVLIAHRLLLLAPLLLVIPCFTLFNINKHEKLLSRDCNASEQATAKIREMVDGLQHIRVSRKESQNVSQIYALTRSSYQHRLLEYSLRDWFSFMNNLSGTSFIACAIVFAQVQPQLFTPSSIGIAMLSAARYSDSLLPPLRHSLAIRSSLRISRYLQDFIDNTPQEKLPPEAVDIDMPSNWPQRGDISIQNITSRYRPSEMSSAVLDGVSLKIVGRQKVGIIGRSGGGKTSLLLTLLNFLNYTGKIVIDDIDISMVPHNELRKRITTISQDIIELEGTLRFNLIPYIMGGEALGTVDQENIFEVLKRLGLEEHVERFGGIDLPLKEYGFSQGQLQLVGIGRAILHNMETKSTIVLMDEPSSNLDLETARRIHDLMEDAFQHCTVLMVAHQVDLLQETDIIIKIEKGKIVAKSTTHRENGLPASLLA